MARHNVITVGTKHVHKDRLHGSPSSCIDCGKIRAAQYELDSARRKTASAEQEYVTAKSATENAAKAIPQPEWASELPPIEPKPE